MVVDEPIRVDVVLVVHGRMEQDAQAAALQGRYGDDRHAEHFRQAGVPDAQIDALTIAGMENFPVFRKTILEGAAPVMDTDAVGAEIGAAAAAMTDGQPLDALLLECTDLSVFARTVQEAVSVPVYDINSLIAYAAFCVRRNQWV